MQSISASFAKQSFGEALALCAQGPVRIERHRKTVAGLVSPKLLDVLAQHDERRAARLAQAQTEQRRLMWHQRLAIDLLCMEDAGRVEVLARAEAVVQRWQDQNLCSKGYVDRWRQWLALDVRELAQAMCGDADGWGNAMRQNSPFRGSAANLDSA